MFVPGHKNPGAIYGGRVFPCHHPPLISKIHFRSWVEWPKILHWLSLWACSGSQVPWPI